MRDDAYVNSGAPRRPNAWQLGIVILLVGVLVGCSLPWRKAGGEQPAQPHEQASPAPVQEIPVRTPTPRTSAASPSWTGESGPLVWWTPQDHAPQPLADSPAAEVLATQLADFTQEGGEQVHVILKKPFGKGGLLDFLRTAAAAAPPVLPDLITLHSEELATAVRAGLLQPLDSLIPAEVSEDLFPFALQAGQVDGVLYGLMWDADISHLAYDTRALDTPPRTWDELLASEATLAIPGATVEGRVNDSFLLQYAGAGGNLIPQEGELTVDGVALRRVLEFLASARQSGRLPDLVLSLADPAACWEALLAGQVQMAQVQASQYLEAHAQAAWTGYATTPTWDGRVVSIGHGWMLAIVTQDPKRQARAAKFLTWLLQPDHAGDWTKAGYRLPARRAALAQWGEDDPYVAFLRQQMEAALPRPHNDAFAGISRAFQWAERQVLSGEATPDQVVTEVLAEVNP